MKNDTQTSLVPVSSQDLLAESFSFSRSVLSGEAQETVSARDLHTFLGVGRDFSNWIKGRIEEYSFLEGEDFTKVLAPLAENGEAQPRGFEDDLPDSANKVEYFLSLDMAKELSMVERTPKGRECRRYFIARDKLASQLTRQQANQIRQEAESLLSGAAIHILERSHAENRAKELQSVLDSYLREEIHISTPNGYESPGTCHTFLGAGISQLDFYDAMFASKISTVQVRHGKRTLIKFQAIDAYNATHEFIAGLEKRGEGTWFSPLLNRVIKANPRGRT